MTKVLVVDDDKITRERLAKILSKEGLDVLTADNGEHAMEVFEKEKPGIILTDLRMPKIDGMELLRHVKKIEPLTQVILITAHGDADLAIHALRGGALDYLRKPIDLDQLLLALGRAKENIATHYDPQLASTILIMEDDEMARNRLARVLVKEGYEVLTAADGVEGLQCVEDSRVDVILVDLRMPKKDGLTVLREIRTITEDVETIVVTGYGDEESAVQAMRDGAANFLRKPIDLDQMFMAIEKAIEKLKLRRSLQYRGRDLELAREIVATLTKKKELVVDIRATGHGSAIDFAESLIDQIPLALLVIGEQGELLFANEAVKSRAPHKDIAIDAEFFAALGLASMSVDGFNALVRKVLKSPAPAVETLEVSRHAFVLMSKLFLLTDEGHTKVAIIVLRGERSQAE